MNHTPQIKKAIQFAARKHRTHVRRGSDRTPYISHLFSVALLVAEDGADDDVVTAALLHDTLEDTETTREELENAFNERVADLVEQVSEEKEYDWEQRHERYVARLAQADDEALIIALADKVDNVEDKIATIEREGPGFLASFTNKSPHAYADFNAEILKIAQKRLPEHRLTKRFSEVHMKERAMLSGL